MKTIETINTLCQKDASLYRAHRDELLANIKTLDECVSEARDNNESVRSAVKTFVSKVGEYAAKVTVASLINRSAWDGRISTANANWAKSVEDAWDEESMTRMYAYAEMHMAHLDQTADYVRRNLDEITAEIEDERKEASQTDATIPEADLDEAVAEEVQKELEAEQKAKTEAKATDLIQKVRRHFDLFESCRSAWDKGVRVYADELLDELLDAIRGGWVDLDDMASDKLVRKALLNGASDWKEYSWGGCSLIYDQDIAERLCTPSELKKTRHGERRPNGREEWLDVQARALRQACGRIGRGMKYAIRQQLKEEVA